MKETSASRIINNYLKKHGLTKTELSKLCDISLPTLNNVMQCHPKVNMRNVMKVAYIINASIDDMFADLIKKYDRGL